MFNVIPEGRGKYVLLSVASMLISVCIGAEVSSAQGWDAAGLGALALVLGFGGLYGAAANTEGE